VSRLWWETKAEIEGLFADLGDNSFVDNGNPKVQAIDRGAQVSEDPFEFATVHGGLESCPFVVMQFDVGVGREEPGSKAVIKAGTVKWEVFAELWNVCQFGDSKEEGGTHRRWLGAHGGAFELLPGCISKSEDTVAHNDLECLYWGLGGGLYGKGEKCARRRQQCTGRDRCQCWHAWMWRHR
jgi:hypothetical protein